MTGGIQTLEDIMLWLDSCWREEVETKEEEDEYVHTV